MIQRIFVVAVILCTSFFIFRTGRAEAANLFFSPSQKTVTIGSRLTVTLKVNSGGEAINASEGTIAFTNDFLRLTSISKSGTQFTFWPVEPNGSTTSGRVTFSGGLPSPGYRGSSGTIVSLSFETVKTGRAELSISGAKVLANDGQGTNVLTSMSGASLTITDVSVPSTPPPANSTTPAPTMTSSNFPDQNAWYRDDQATVSWTKPNGASGFSFRLSQNVGDVPDDVVDTAATLTSMSLPTDGIWYVALRAHYAAGWSATNRFRLQRDHVSPSTFAIKITRDRGLTDPSPEISFSASDETSGIDHYTLSLDGGTASEETSPARLGDLSAGHHAVVVMALDRAGNLTSSQTSVEQIGYPSPTVSDVSSPLLLLDRLVVKGVATAGDTVTVMVDGQAIGQAVAGQVDAVSKAQGVTIRSPWILTTDRLFRPGHYQVTAQATSVDGQVSVASDPVPLYISGHSVWFGGQPIAVFAAAPLAALGLLTLAGLITWTMTRLLLAFKRMHHREVVVERELEDLRRKVKRGQANAVDLDESLEEIERDLLRPLRPTTRRARRSPRRR